MTGKKYTDDAYNRLKFETLVLRDIIGIRMHKKRPSMRVSTNFKHSNTGREKVEIEVLHDHQVDAETIYQKPMDQQEGMLNIVQKMIDPNTIFYFMQNINIGGQNLYNIDSFKEWFEFRTN